MRNTTRNNKLIKTDDQQLHAVSLAAHWIRKGLELLLSVLANDHQRIAGEIEDYHKRQALAQIVACDFKTNDWVRLIHGRRSGRLQINATSIDLDHREFLVIKALAVSRHALPQPAFVPMETILAHIEEHRQEDKLVDRWRYPMPEDVRRVVLSVRTKILDAGGNRLLIEGKHGDGYRLSSPHVDVIACSDPMINET